MKKIALILAVSLMFSITCSASSTENSTKIEPKASVVFNCVGAAINRTSYAGDCSLINYGNGEIQVILQFLNPVYSGWQTYQGNKCSITFTNKIGAAVGDTCSLPAGKYRTKTIATATVNGVTESKTTYSPELVVY